MKDRVSRRPPSAASRDRKRRRTVDPRRSCPPRPTWSRPRWTVKQVFELIRDRLADILEIDPAAITEGDSFADDLEADSLALIELVEALEEELGERTVGFRIDDEDLEDLKTVRDAVDYVVAEPRLKPRGRCPDPADLRGPALATGSGTSSTTRGCSARRSSHRSWCAEHPGAKSNERLEFLGDAVLGLVVTDHLFRAYPDLPEGELAKVRAPRS